jgi:hypothetical protein
MAGAIPIGSYLSELSNPVLAPERRMKNLSKNKGV